MSVDTYHAEKIYHLEQQVKDLVAEVSSLKVMLMARIAEINKLNKHVYNKTTLGEEPTLDEREIWYNPNS